MLRLVGDEDVHDAIIRGLRRREPTVDIVRVVDVGLDHKPDPVILEWAASQERVLVTGDLNTMVGFAGVGCGQPCPCQACSPCWKTSASAESLTTSSWSRCAMR